MKIFFYSYWWVAGLIALTTLIIWDRWKIEKWKRMMEARVSGTVAPYWRTIQTAAIPKLMHPHAAAERADELLLILLNNPTHKMSDEDRAELNRRMQAVAAGEDPMITGKDEQALAEVMPVIMRQVEMEDANPSPITDVQLVGSKGDLHPNG
jgi:hypothetical protein